MELHSDGVSAADLQRTLSQISSRSTKSHRSETVRVKPRKIASNSSFASSRSVSDKSLTSFPSISPESPKDSRNGRADALVPDEETPRSRKHSKALPSIVDTLTASSPSLRQRSALFDDSPVSVRDVPGALHHASNEHIERLIAKNGAVTMVRQLAEDLAQRDAQITALRRRAEERERILKKMLRECEVSNLDMEMRLRELDTAMASMDTTTGGYQSGTTRKISGADSILSTNSLGDMMDQAMKDTLQPERDDSSSLALAEDEDQQATIRASSALSGNDDNTSTVSGEASNRLNKDTTKGWKSYIWGGTGTTRKPSTSTGDSTVSRNSAAAAALASGATRRKRLNNDLFQPPEGQDDSSSIHSRKSSSSVTSWALKLVAGAPQNGRDGGTQIQNRGRAATTADGLRRDIPVPASAQAGKQQSPARAALSRVYSQSEVARRAMNASNTNRKEVLKSASPESTRSSALGIFPVGSPESTSFHAANNAGPVEMDSILPPEILPPSLSQFGYRSADHLIDRFGFIYDQSRNLRQREAFESAKHHRRESVKEMLSSGRDSVNAPSDEEDNDGSLNPSAAGDVQRPDTPLSIEENKPRKRWQDYLKAATFPTELLSHTPSAAPITTLETADSEDTPKVSQFKFQHRGSIPSASINPEPAASHIVAENAEFSKSTSSGHSTPTTPGAEESEPAKLLLEQLTDLHDSLQRDKTVKWNEFLRKVRAERKREGEAAFLVEGLTHKTLMPETSMTDGEMIGVAGLGNKGKVGRAKWNEFYRLVLGGIPVPYRAKIWAECSGATAMRVPGHYDDMVSSGIDDPTILSQIQMDIHRTLTDNVFFREGPGVEKLNEVLIAYSRRNPDVGYCQGMNLIAGSLLLIMPTAEDAFWVLTSMVEHILPQNYYDHSLLASRADQQVLRQYVTEVLPKLSAHLDSLGIELEAMTFQWFLSVFTDCLSAEALYRVWDVVLCTNDGSTFLFQVALALLKLNEGQLLEQKSPAGVYSYINHNMTNHAISIDGLINASEALKKEVRRVEVEERRAKAVQEEREMMRQRELARLETKQKRRSNGLKLAQREEGVESDDGGREGELRVQPPVPIDEDD